MLIPYPANAETRAAFSFFLRLVAFVILLKVATYGAWYGSAGWDEAFVNERTFSLSFGWFNWGSLISWSFYLIFFFALGLLVASSFGPPHATWWAVALGLAYGLLSLQHSGHFFQPGDSWGAYVFAYGTYAMPALGSLCGALAAKLLARRHITHLGA